LDTASHNPHILHRFAYRTYSALVWHVRSNGLLHLWLFGFRPCPGSLTHGAYWDWATLVLKGALRKHLNPEARFLDMGTGAVAALAIFAALRIGCRQIKAVDVLPDIVSSARKNAEQAGVNIQFGSSDLFSNIDGLFEVVAFNAPYMDPETGRALGILQDERSEKRFSGGHGGGETIARFLRDATAHLADGGLILLGVNHYHISRSTVLGLIGESNMELFDRIENRWTRAVAYILRYVGSQNSDEGSSGCA
jgi:methylase of polypeptide subunit release factors